MRQEDSDVGQTAGRCYCKVYYYQQKQSPTLPYCCFCCDVRRRQRTSSAQREKYKGESRIDQRDTGFVEPVWFVVVCVVVGGMMHDMS